MTIKEYDFSSKRALIRVDFNVPFDNETGLISDDTRIKLAIPTIKWVLSKGGSVVLMSHMGRPKDMYQQEFSLNRIVTTLNEFLGEKVHFLADCISEESFNCTKNLKPGQVVLLENLRFYAQEKKGDVDFAKQLARHGDVYINDAFGTAHRAHASTTIVANFFPSNKLFGFLIENEIKSVNKVLESDDKPLTAIVGGAKVSSKITIISRLLDKVDHIIIGGGMAYTFIKAQGGNVGNSLVEDDFLDEALKIIDLAKANGVKFHLPTDTVIADEFSNDAQVDNTPIDNVLAGWMGLDIGVESIHTFCEVIANSKLILWNGPMGVFELDKFQAGTAAIARAVASATEKGAFSLIGGGDSVAAINKYKLANMVSHVSTGGGAMLEYLEGKSLPGIQAIEQ